MLTYIILVNWNGWRDTAACVESCAHLTGAAYRLLVVDNHSSDDSVAQLRERFPHLRIEVTAENLGFAGGNNVGIELALAEGADFVWLLNNDTTVAPDSLSELLRAAAEHPGAGMFGSKVLYHARPDTIWFAGGFLDPKRAGYPRHVGADQVDDGRFDEPATADFLTGCSLLVRRQVIDQIGPVAEEFFMYWEDVEWCARAQAAGWECRYVPASRVWHKVASSIRGAGHLNLRYETRNRLTFYRRYEPRRYRRVLAWTLRDVLALAVRLHLSNARARLAGVLDHLRGRTGRIGARQSPWGTVSAHRTSSIDRSTP